MGAMRLVATREILTDLCVRHPSDFPGTIEVLEMRPAKPFFGEIAEDQVAFRKRRVLGEIPGLANREVPEKVFGGTRLQGNRDQVAEQVTSFGEVRIGACQKQKVELGQFSKQRQVRLQMMNESGEIGLRSLKIREGYDARRRRSFGEEHREAVHEKANRWFYGVASSVSFGRQTMRGKPQVRAEVRDLSGFCFKVLFGEVCEHEVQHGHARLYVLEFML